MSSSASNGIVSLKEGLESYLQYVHDHGTEPPSPRNNNSPRINEFLNQVAQLTRILCRCLVELESLGYS
ncbi:hypothetical protein M9Y10_002786 [Tritrichomonas musculus]|uniref:Uncharacterized protein n=1 Tax=Tritrichomonas musculus TaxID=1915356 RepID=A0ABR2LAU1_9EUKA